MEPFEVERQIGEGAFTEAFLVKSKSSGERFVLKKIRITSDKQRENAIKEVRILKTLDHPNIVSYRDGYTASVDSDGEATRVYLAMEYCENGDLSKIIKNRKGKRFSQDEVLSWFAQLCSAISYTHDNGIVHRDLKPQNIFFTSNNIVKIGDYGIATTLENTVAMAKTMCGTFGYLAPEVLKMIPYDGKCDIWSLGCILFEMITLEEPFPQGIFNFVASMDKLVVPVPSGCLESIKNLVAMMLKHQPRERASIRKVISELEKIRPSKPQLARKIARDGRMLFVSCDGCHTELANVRFKCVECRDHDLCMACVQRGRHAEHALLRICANMEGKWVHTNVKCDECSEMPIQGIRFKCLGCKDYNLCEICFRGKKHPYHKFAIVCEPSIKTQFVWS